MLKTLIFRIWNLFRISIFEFRIFLLDVLFPRFCVGCGIEGTFLCKSCKKEILPVKMQVCPKCGRISDMGRYCGKCRWDEVRIKKQVSRGKTKTIIIKQRNPLEGVIAATYFEEGPIREMIHNLKYNGVLELVKPLGKIMAEALKENFQLSISNKSINQLKHCIIKNSFKIKNLPAGRQGLKFKIVLVPVPLHFLRRARRGYNQAEILAKEISCQTKIPCANLLIKTKNSKPQAKLSGKKRQLNLKNAYKLNHYSIKNLFKIKNLPAGRQGLKLKIILVDDISTTGATLNECAKVLKEAGFREVWGLVVARG